jgi:hypothetical protein
LPLSACGWYSLIVSDMSPEDREAEIARLEAMLGASQSYSGSGGYKERIEAINASLAELRDE